MFSGWNWLSFIVGALLAGVVLFFQGFIRAAGRDAWRWVKNKFSPEDIEVGGRFEVVGVDPGETAWVPPDKRYNYEATAWTYYKHPQNRARCYRIVGNNRHEYLMVSPEAAQEDD